MRGKFKNEWLPALVNGTYEEQLENVKVVSLKKKAIHLIFEGGQASEVAARPDVLQEVRSMKKLAGRVGFEWFVFSQGEAVPGEVFIRKFLAGE